MPEQVVAVIAVSVCLLLVVSALIILVTAARRRRSGDDVVEQRGWERHPDGEDIVSGWDGWPLVKAPGRTHT